MAEELKCKVCGRTFYKKEFLSGANLFAERVCPECKRARAFSGGGAEASEANAKLAEAQANAIKKQADIVAKSQKMAAEAAFAESMSNLTFSGDPEEVIKDFELAYQYWLKTDLKNDQKKIVADKLELGLMALKKADSTKGEFYEQKVLSEKKKRKIIKIVKIAGTAIVIIVLFIMIGLAN